METKTLTESLIKAEQMGRDAFERGVMCAPALDTNVPAMLSGYAGQASIALLIAWHRGWLEANLAAPVPGLD